MFTNIQFVRRNELENKHLAGKEPAHLVHDSVVCHYFKF